MSDDRGVNLVRFTAHTVWRYQPDSRSSSFSDVSPQRSLGENRQSPKKDERELGRQHQTSVYSFHLK